MGGFLRSSVSVGTRSDPPRITAGAALACSTPAPPCDGPALPTCLVRLAARPPADAQANSFVVEVDSSGFGQYARGGIVTQAKQAKALAFKPLAQALEEPGEFLFSDFSKMERPALLHVGFQALDAFQVRVWAACECEARVCAWMRTRRSQAIAC